MGPVFYFCSSRTCYHPLPHFCRSRTCYHPLPHFMAIPLALWLKMLLYFLQLQKLKETKYFYIFIYGLNGRDIAICLFYHRLPQNYCRKTTKWPYLSHFASKWKNKGTLFSSILKVVGNNVLSFFHFGLKQLRYRHLLGFFIICLNIIDEKQQNGHISVILPPNEKIKALYFLQC